MSTILEEESQATEAEDIEGEVARLQQLLQQKEEIIL